MEENIFNGTSCTSFDPSKIQCDKEGNLPIHTLNKYCEETDTRYNIFPTTVIQAVFDGVNGLRLDRILAACNSVYLTWEGTFGDTVGKLDKIYRRKGYIITYRDELNINWTQRYNSEDISDEAWANPDNWEGWSFDTIIDDLSEALENIFKNIYEYQDFFNILVGFVGDFVNNVFNNINEYPDIKNIIENTTADRLPDVIKNIFININEHPELIAVLNKYIKEYTEVIFNNIASYPELNKFITETINKYVEDNINNIFNNLDNNPKLRDLIINNTINKVTDIFNNIGQYPELLDKVQQLINSRVDYIFNNIEKYPELVGMLSDLICVCVKNIFNNISLYPNLIRCINEAVNNRVDYIFNNLDLFPILKNLIETKIVQRVNYIFENINSFVELLNVIKGNIEYIFNNLNVYPNLKILIETKTSDTVENILTNLDNFPIIKTKVLQLINDTINNKKGVPNGIAELDNEGKIIASQLPSYVDDVLEGYFIDGEHFAEKYIDDEPIYYIPDKGKLYVDISEDTEYSNKIYRWSGSRYVVIADSLALGEVTGTAYDGAKGKANRDALLSMPNVLSRIIGVDLDPDKAVINTKIHNKIEDGIGYDVETNGIPIEIPSATTDNAGVMSAEDKTKLNNINNYFDTVQNNVITLRNIGTEIPESEINKIDLINTTNVYVTLDQTPIRESLGVPINYRLFVYKYNNDNSELYLYCINPVMDIEDRIHFVKYTIKFNEGVYTFDGMEDLYLPFWNDFEIKIEELVNNAITNLIPEGYEFVIKKKSPVIVFEAAETEITLDTNQGQTKYILPVTSTSDNEFVEYNMYISGNKEYVSVSYGRDGISLSYNRSEGTTFTITLTRSDTVKVIKINVKVNRTNYYELKAWSDSKSTINRDNIYNKFIIDNINGEYVTRNLRISSSHIIGRNIQKYIEPEFINDDYNFNINSTTSEFIKSVELIPVNDYVNSIATINIVEDGEIKNSINADIEIGHTVELKQDDIIVYNDNFEELITPNVISILDGETADYTLTTTRDDSMFIEIVDGKSIKLLSNKVGNFNVYAQINGYYYSILFRVIVEENNVEEGNVE